MLEDQERWLTSELDGVGKRLGELRKEKGGEKCLMDLEVEDLEEGAGDGDSVLEEALPLGLMSVWGEEDYHGVAII